MAIDLGKTVGCCGEFNYLIVYKCRDRVWSIQNTVSGVSSARMLILVDRTLTFDVIPALRLLSTDLAINRSHIEKFSPKPQLERNSCVNRIRWSRSLVSSLNVSSPRHLSKYPFTQNKRTRLEINCGYHVTSESETKCYILIYVGIPSSNLISGFKNLKKGSKILITSYMYLWEKISVWLARWGDKTANSTYSIIVNIFIKPKQ